MIHSTKLHHRLFQPPSRWARLPILPLLLVAPLVLAGRVHAQGTPTWTGASDSVWTNPLNWASGIVPGIGAPAYLGVSSNYIVNYGSGNLDLSGLTLDAPTKYTMSGTGTLSLGISGVQVLQGSHALQGPVNVSEDSGGFHVAANASLTMSGTGISGSGPVLKTGPGRLDLPNVNTFSGGVALTEGTLVAPFDQSFGAQNEVTLGGGTLRLRSSFGSSSARTFVLTATSVIEADGNISFSGPFTGTGDLEVSGEEVRFNGTSTFDGAVVTVFRGLDTAVGGSGHLAGDLVIDELVQDMGDFTQIDTGRLRPGSSSVGTLTVDGDTTLRGIYECELDGLRSDRIVVGGTLDLTGGRLEVQELGGLFNGPFVIATYGSLTGTFEAITGMPHGYVIDYAYDDGSGSNHIALVPTVAPALLRWPLEEGDGPSTVAFAAGIQVTSSLVGAVAFGEGISPVGNQSLDLGVDTPPSYVDGGTLTTTNTYVTGSDPDYRVLSNHWSITAWIRLPSPQSSTTYRVIASSDTGPGSDWWSFSVRDFAGVQENLGFDFANTPVYSGLSIPLDRRVFVAVVADTSGATVGGGTNRHRFLVWDGTGWQASDGPEFRHMRLQGIEIGSFFSDRQFDGQIDEVRIFDRSLTQIELDELARFPDGSYEAYTVAEGLGIDQPEADFDLDFDNDGFSNGLEWAIFSSATNALDTGRIEISDPLGDGYRYINFRRNSYAAGILYYIQRSVDLSPGSWSDLIVYDDVDGWTLVDGDDYEDLSTENAHVIHHSIGVPMGDAPKAFFRLRLEQP